LNIFLHKVVVIWGYTKPYFWDLHNYTGIKSLRL